MGSNCCKGDAAGRPIRSSSSIYNRSRAGASLDDRFTVSDDTGGVRLTVTAARTGDSGVYTLQASNAAGSDTARVRLEVSPDELPTGDDPPTFLRRLQDLTVKVGTRTRFLVEIVSSTECKVTWYRNERRLLEAERIALVRDGNFWCADVAAVSVDDAGRWTCTAENAGGRASCSAHLNVLVPKAYKRPEFVEELRALLTEQGTVSLECKVVGVPTPVLRWFKDSREIKAGDVFALTANAEDPTSLGTYTCEAVNCMGRAYSSSKVHVVGRISREGSSRPGSSGLTPEPPPIFTKELEGQQVKICEPLTLSCQIVVPPWPRSVVWYNKEGKVDASERYHVLEDGIGGYLLEMPSAEWSDEGEWKCVATSSGGRVGISTCYVSMDVPKNYRKPRFMENLQAVLTEEGLVSFECKVVGFPTPVLSWFKDGQELKPGDVYQLTGTNSLGSYCCIAKNCMGQASSSAELTVEDIQNQLNEEEKLQLFSKNQAPKFVQGLKSVEAKIDEPFRFTVKVAIPPEPSMLWYRDDQPVDESTRCHHGKEDRGVFYLDIVNLEFLDQAEWKCVAMNDFGHSVTSCFLKLIIPRHYKKPRFLENLQAILSDEGAVNLECKVIGVPQPTLKWYKDGEELKPGDIHRIISGQDGTCCLGTYTCEAQNCMGIAASSASLLGFDDSMKAKTKKKAEDQALQRNLSLSTIHEERTSQMYDTPVGDITLDDKGEISFSFDGKEVSVSLYETPDLTEEEALQIVEMYADQLSENVTEHNVVELPPLRFVKETSTSGNLLMEAIIIDVSPEYFVSPEEDLRTEADVEDISIADENIVPQLSLDMDIGGEDYLEKTMALLSEKADLPKKIPRKKSDSQRSVDDYYSLSHEQSLSEDKKDDDTQALSESDLQSFASARSSGKPKSKSSKPLAEEKESSEMIQTMLIHNESQKHKVEHEDIEPVVKPKRERRSSRSSRRSSSGSEKSISKPKDEHTRIKVEVEELPKNLTISDDEFKNNIFNISSFLSKIVNDIQIIERDIILKSELMSSAATASRSLEIISSLITPLSEIHSIADAAKESLTEPKEVTSTFFNSLPYPLKNLQQSLTIVEKCIDMESDSKTLVKKTCVAFIEKCSDEMQKLMTEINSAVTKDCLITEQKIISEIQTLANEVKTVVKSSTDVVNKRIILSEASEIKVEEPTYETQHLRDTQKAVFELKNPLNSLLSIIESANSGKITDVTKIKHSEVILNDMSASIQDLQMALEQIETLSVKESTSSLNKYNTEIIEAVMESVLQLRSSFETLSGETIVEEDKAILKQALLSIEHNLCQISSQIQSVERNVGTFDVLQSDNKLEALQKTAQILIALENNLPRLESLPEIKTHMNKFHKNLTKVLENVIESNEAGKYFTLLEICDAVHRINTSINNIEIDSVLSLASLSNTLKIIQEHFVRNVFDSELNCSILSNISDVLIDIQEAINHAEEVSIQIDSEHVQDLSTHVSKEIKPKFVIEHIEQTIAAINNVKSLEITQDFRHTFTPVLENIGPILEDFKHSIASTKPIQINQQEQVSDISDFSLTQTFAIPLCELNQNIVVLNQTIVDNIENLKENNEMAAALAEPLHELYKTLEILQQNVISQYEENVTPYEVSMHMATAVKSVQSCIVMIQENGGVENVDDMSTLEDISGIKTTAEAIPSDRLVLPAAQEPLIEQSTGMLNQEVPKSATANALQLLNEHIVILQNPVVIDAMDTLSEVSDYCSLKSVAVGLGELHASVEEIIQPIVIESSTDFPGVINTSKITALAEPMLELQQSLAVIDIKNIPILEHILDLPADKIHSVFQNIFDFKDQLDKCLQVICPAIEMTNQTVEVSSKVESLREMCHQLKGILISTKEVSKDNSQIHKIVELEETINNLIIATDITKDIKIEQVKWLTKNLYEKVINVQDDIVQFAPTKSELAQEAKLVQIIDDVETNIAVLEQYDFVDLSRVSEMTSCTSSHFANEIESESLTQINDIVENAVNIFQESAQGTTIADYAIVEDFFKTVKNEFIILHCLMKKKMSHKKILRLIQEFQLVQNTINDFKSKKDMLNLPNDLDRCLEDFFIHSDECLANFRNSLSKIVKIQSDTLINNPLTILHGGSEILNEVLNNSKYCDLSEVTKNLVSAAHLIIPEMVNAEITIIDELNNPNIVETADNEKLLRILDNVTLNIETQIKNVSIQDDIKKALKDIGNCIEKHQGYKDGTMTAKQLISIKCLSDCFKIIQETLAERREQTIQIEKIEPAVTESKAAENALKSILSEMIVPLQSLHDKLVNIQKSVVSGADDDTISIELTSTESLVQTMADIHKGIIEQMAFEELIIDTEDISILTEVDKEIHSIRDSIKSIENVQIAQTVKEIAKPIEAIEKSLQVILCSDKVIVEDKEKLPKDINSNIDSLESALERFINVKVALLTTFGLFPNVDFFKCEEIAVQLKKMLMLTFEDLESEIVLQKKKEKILALRTILSKIDWLNIDTVLEGKSLLQIEQVKRISLAIYQLLAVLDQVDCEISNLNRSKVNVVQLQQHIDQYIELEEIVDELSAIIKIDNFKDTVSIARKLQENIALLESNINAESSLKQIADIKMDQVDLAHQLQNTLITLQTQAVNEAQELTTSYNENVLQQMATVTAQLQADLVGLTGVQVALQTPSELLVAVPQYNTVNYEQDLFIAEGEQVATEDKSAAINDNTDLVAITDDIAQTVAYTTIDEAVIEESEIVVIEELQKTGVENLSAKSISETRATITEKSESSSSVAIEETQINTEKEVPLDITDRIGEKKESVEDEIKTIYEISLATTEQSEISFAVADEETQVIREKEMPLESIDEIGDKKQSVEDEIKPISEICRAITEKSESTSAVSIDKTQITTEKEGPLDSSDSIRERKESADDEIKLISEIGIANTELSENSLTVAIEETQIISENEVPLENIGRIGDKKESEEDEIKPVSEIGSAITEKSESTSAVSIDETQIITVNEGPLDSTDSIRERKETAEDEIKLISKIGAAITEKSEDSSTVAIEETQVIAEIEVPKNNTINETCIVLEQSREEKLEAMLDSKEDQTKTESEIQEVTTAGHKILAEQIGEYVDQILEFTQDLPPSPKIEDLKKSASLANELKETILIYEPKFDTESSDLILKKVLSEKPDIVNDLSDMLCALNTMMVIPYQETEPLVNTDNINMILKVITRLQEALEISTQESVEENSMMHLEKLLQEINNKIISSSPDRTIEDTEALCNTLDEVQTLIIKLKRDFDATLNDTLNETLEDLECSVRSVQLQITEDSPTELLKEACATLQLLVTNMNETEHGPSLTVPLIKIKTEDILENCTHETQDTIDLLDSVSKIDIKHSEHMPNIISNLNSLNDSIKVLKLSFNEDAETLIEKGVDVLQKLNQIEDKVFSLEKDIETENIAAEFKDIIVTAIHSVYGSVSNMRSTMSSIQKKYMHENYGKPSEHILKAIKNVSKICNTDNDKVEKSKLQTFCKTLRKVLNHFEDIRFYVNLDKTARLPSDAAFTKVILEELKYSITEIILPLAAKLGPNVAEKASQVLNHIEIVFNNIELRSTLEVKEKIPIFKAISTYILNLTNTLEVNTQVSITESNESCGNPQVQLYVDQNEPITFTSQADDKMDEIDYAQIDKLSAEIVQEIVSESIIRLQDMEDTSKLIENIDQSQSVIQNIEPSKVSEDTKIVTFSSEIQESITEDAAISEKETDSFTTLSQKEENFGFEEEKATCSEDETSKSQIEVSIEKSLVLNEEGTSGTTKIESKKSKENSKQTEGVKEENYTSINNRTEDKQLEECVIPEEQEKEVIEEEIAETKTNQSTREEKEMKFEEEAGNNEVTEENALTEEIVKQHSKDYLANPDEEAELTLMQESETKQITEEKVLKEKVATERKNQEETNHRKPEDDKDNKTANNETINKKQKEEEDMQKIAEDKSLEKLEEAGRNIKGEAENRDNVNQKTMTEKNEFESIQKEEPEQVEIERKPKEEAESKNNNKQEILEKKEDGKKKLEEESLFAKQEQKEADKELNKEAKDKQKDEADFIAEEAESKLKDTDIEIKLKDDAEKKKKEEADLLVQHKQEDSVRNIKENADEKQEEADFLAMEKHEDAERKLKEDANKKQNEEIDHAKQEQENSERKFKEDIEEQQKEEAVLAEQKQEDAERKLKQDSEKKEKGEAAALVKQKQEDVEIKLKEDAEKKQKEEADLLAKQKHEDAERKLKEDTDKEQKEEADKKQKEETDLFAKQRQEDEDRKLKENAEKKQKEEADLLAIQKQEDAQRKLKEDAEKKQKEETDKKEKVDADLLSKHKQEDAERKLKEDAEKKQKEESDLLAIQKQGDAERKLKDDAEKKQKVETDLLAIQKQEDADRKLKEDAENKQKEQADKRQKEEADHLAKQKQEDAERKLKEDAGKKQKDEADLLAKQKQEDAERKLKEDADKKQKEESDLLAIQNQEDAARKLKEDAEKKQKEEADLLAKQKQEDAERKLKEDAEKKQKEEADLLAKQKQEDAERKLKEDAVKKQKEEADHLAKQKQEEAERKLKEDAEKKEKEEADKKQKEEAVLLAKQKQEDAERKLKEDAEKKQKEEADLLAKHKQEDAERKLKEDADKKQKEEADHLAKQKQEEAVIKLKEDAEKKEKEEADKKQKEEADKKQKEEADLVAKQKQENAERKLKEDAEKKQKEEADLLAKQKQEDAERKLEEDAEKKQKEEADLLAKQKQEDAERKFKEDAVKKQKEEADHLAKQKQEEAERKLKEDANKKQKEEADLAKQKQEDAERKLKEDAEKKQKEEADLAKQKKEDAERKLKEDADKKQKEEADHLAKQKQEEAARKLKEDADKKQKEEADKKQKEEADLLAKQKQEDAERKLKEDAEKKQKEEADLLAKQKQEDAESKLKEDADKKPKEEADHLAKQKQEDAERKIKEDAEKKEKEEADKKQKKEADLLAKQKQEDAERKPKEDVEKKQKEGANLLAKKKQEEAERKLKEDADKKQKKEADLLAKKKQEDAERKLKEDAEKKQKEEADLAKQKQEDAERKLKEDADKKQKEEADHLAKQKQEEAERKLKEDADKKQKEEADKKQKEEADLLAKQKQEDAERKLKEDAEKKQKEEADLLAKQKQEDAERKLKEDADKKQKEEADHLAKQKQEDAERKLKEDADKRQKEEADHLAKQKQEDAERKLKEDAGKKQKEEADLLAKQKQEDAERKLKEEAEKKQKEEGNLLAKQKQEDAARKLKQDAEKRQNEEADLLDKQKLKDEVEKKLKKETKLKSSAQKKASAEKAPVERKKKEEEDHIAMQKQEEELRKLKDDTKKEKNVEDKVTIEQEDFLRIQKDKSERLADHEENESKKIIQETDKKKKSNKTVIADKEAHAEQQQEDLIYPDMDKQEKAEYKIISMDQVIAKIEEAETNQEENTDRLTKKKHKDSDKNLKKQNVFNLSQEYKEIHIKNVTKTSSQAEIENIEYSNKYETCKEINGFKEKKETLKLKQKFGEQEDIHKNGVSHIYEGVNEKDDTQQFSSGLQYHYIKEYQYEPASTSRTKSDIEKSRFIDHGHKDYTMEFTRPPGYRERTYDAEKYMDRVEVPLSSGRSPVVYKTQTLLLDAKLRSSVPPLHDVKRSSEPTERRSEARYRTKAVSEARSIVSEKRTSMLRDIKRKPVFSTFLTDRTAVEGSRVKLTCSVLSSTDPTITWYKNGVLLDDKLKYRTKFVDGLITMEVLNAVPSDSAEYSCTVKNENGSISTSANLKVYPSFEASPIPPTFTRSIRDTFHLAENELVLECRIRGQPLPSITWLKDGKSVNDNERYQAYYLADGVCRLSISSPTPEDSGKYTCKAENSIWCDQINHIVTYTGTERCLSPNIATLEKSRFNRQAMESRRPHFTNVLADYKVARGGTIGLQVEIKGSPTRVEWLREGQSVTETYRNARTFVERGLYTLALADVTEKESGIYTCRAWSTHGNVDMNAAITVIQPNEMEGKPAIIAGRPEKDVLISVGEDLNISFRVQGEPKPKVIFMKGIRDITNSQRVCKMTSDDYVKFTLKRSVVSDAGTYCILARNAYGCDRAFVTVVVRQRADSESLISDWTYPLDDAALSTFERRYKSVPDRIPAEPTVVDGGNNWLTLAWPKPDNGESAPVLAYKIESWLIGKEGGARWVELGITPLNSFDAFNLKQGEEYHFRITPRNRYGWGEPVQTNSSIAVGLAGDRPEFVDILPGQLKVLVGEVANLSCSVKGKPLPEVVWMKNGHEIDEEDHRVSTANNGYSCSLIIKDVKIEDEARYSCEASNVHGRASTYARIAVVSDRLIWEADAKLKRERSADVEGEYPPQFTMRLRDRRVQATYPVRLTCQVVGSPPPSITWFKDGDIVTLDTRRTVSQDEHFHTLEIAPTTLEDGGMYEAMARNNCGAISCRCNLVVDKGIRAYVAPEFCCGLEPLYLLREGEELRISAVVEAYPSVGVTWYRDGIRLRPSRRAIMTLDRDGMIELALASVTPRDAGVYTCTASNEVGRASTSGKVEVADNGLSEKTKTPPMLFSPDVPYSKEPMFIRKPRSSEAHEGDTVIIQCEVVGDPKPDVYWLRDFLKPDYYRDATHFKRVGSGTEYRFEIPHAKLDYTGAYSVVARNVHGEAKAIISLQILAKDPSSSDDAHNIRYGRVEVIPRFERELTDLLSYDGDAIEFECHVTGNPEPDIRWYHYTELIRDYPDFETVYDEGIARLKIKQVTAEDEGTYTCEAFNSLGKASTSACLVVYPPGEPNTLSQRLRRPPALLSAASTPRSTPRSTPARSMSRTRTPGPDPRRLYSPSRQMTPKFVTYPFNKVVDEGDNVVFQCAVKGLPAPWTTWDKDGVIITPSSRITIKEKDEMYRILEIDEVTIEDVGLYRITLENDYGQAEACARLEVISHKGKFYAGVRSYSASPRKSSSYRRRLPSGRQD